MDYGKTIIETKGAFIYRLMHCKERIGKLSLLCSVF